jgi:acetoin utilization deacetylase AcuC-like enzyme
MSTLYIAHPASLDHLTPLGHPERPDRIRAIERALEKERFTSLVREQAPMAEMESLALAHPQEYIVRLRDISPREGLVRIDEDTVMSPGTYEAALRGAGGAVMAVDEVMAGRATNAFVAMRPPGHHAERIRAMGFCFFNNAATPRSAMAPSGSRSSTGMSTTATARRTSSGRMPACSIARPTKRPCTPGPAHSPRQANTGPSSMRP